MPTDGEDPTPLPGQRPMQRSNTFRDLTGNVTDTSFRMARTVSQAARDAINAEMPLGAWAAAAGASSKAPTLGEIRKGSFAESGWRHNTDTLARRPSGHELSAIRDTDDRDSKDAYAAWDAGKLEAGHSSVASTSLTLHEEQENMLPASRASGRSTTADASQPKVTWIKSAAIGLKAFWRWFLTPFGFLVTIYALNVVAWGGMLFLLLCKAAPEMCWALDDQEGWIRDCDHLYSSRRIWLEIDSQILNALFCVTGFGLIPWRFRDLYYLLRWRLLPANKYGRHQKSYGLRTLGGLYRNWVRLPGSDTLDNLSLEQYYAMVYPHESPEPSKHEANLPCVKADALDPRFPWKLYKTPYPPVTGVRAPPTALWKIDFFVWCNVWNTFFQACLCGFMWGMSRFDRPSWSTGLFIALACVVSGVAGIMSFLEGKKIKRIEGVQPDKEALNGTHAFEGRMA